MAVPFGDQILLPFDPSNVLHAATKQYVDGLNGGAVHLSGTETITGTKTFSTSPILPIPTVNQNPVRNDDSRLTNARTPTAHASSHATAGGDPIAPASIGAATSGHTHTPPAPYNFTYAATYAPDWANGEHHWCALTGDITIQEPTNVPSGKVLRLSLTASTAPRTVTIDSTIQRIVGINSAIVIETGKLVVLAIENNPAIADHIAVAKAGN